MSLLARMLPSTQKVRYIHLAEPEPEPFQKCLYTGTQKVTNSCLYIFFCSGHCFMLEDGGEWDNVFYKNLGAKIAALPRDVPRAGETDLFPSVCFR